MCVSASFSVTINFVLTAVQFSAVYYQWFNGANSMLHYESNERKREAKR